MNFGFSSAKLTGIAIALCFFIAHWQVIIAGYHYSSDFSPEASSSLTSSSTSLIALEFCLLYQALLAQIILMR